MADVHLTGKRRLLAGLVVASMLLPVSGCKKKTKKEKEDRYVSGKEVLATDPYFDATVNEVKFPLRKGKTVNDINVMSCEYLDGMAVISYEIHYKIPEGEEFEGYASGGEYYDQGTGIFDVEGNFIRYLKGDSATLYDVATDKDGNVCMFYSFIDYWCSLNYKVEILDPEGNFIRSIIIYDPPIYDLNNSDLQLGDALPDGVIPGEVQETDITMLDDGGVAITGMGRMFVYDAGGKRLCKIDDWGRKIKGNLITAHGKTYVVSVAEHIDGKDDIQIKEVNLKNGSLGKATDASALSGYGQIMATDQGIFVGSFSGCSKYDMSDNELTEVFNWNDTDVDRSVISRVRFTPKDENEYYAVGIQQLNEGVKPYLIHLKRAETNPHAGKKMIVVGGLRVGDDELMTFVDAYNRDPASKARAILVDYADGLSGDDSLVDVERQLYLDIFSGSGPDILVNMGGTEAFRNGQVMEDLNPYLDGAEGISRDDFFDNVFRACERDGKLYHVPVKVHLTGFVANSDLVPYPDGWTYDEFDQAAKNMPENASFMEGTIYNDMLSIFLCTSISRFVDYEKKTVDFENADMTRLMEMSKEYGMDHIPPDEGRQFMEREYADGTSEAGMHDFTRDKFKEGMLALRDKMIYSLNDYSKDIRLLSGHVSFIGYPSLQRTGMAVNPDTTLGIVSAGKYKDLAWDFIRAYLMYDVDVEDISYGLPVRRDLFEKQCRRDLEDGNEFYDSWVRKLHRPPPEDVYAKMEEEDIAGLLDLMEHADVTAGIDRSVFGVISEEAAAYFAGDRTLDEVLKLISNRTKLIVSEY